MAAPITYSFLDVNAAISGPGGSFSLGSGAGNAKEGISIEFLSDRDAMLIGADGSPMHSLRADKSAKVTVRLLKNSPVNAQMSAMFNAQAVSGTTWGGNTITIVNKNSGDLSICQYCAFLKHTTINYAEDGDVNVWEFNSGVTDIALGAGVQA